MKYKVKNSYNFLKAALVLLIQGLLYISQILNYYNNC